MIYFRKDEHKGKYPLKKETSQYKRRQQGCATVKERDVDKKDHSQDYNVEKESNDRRKQYNQENLEE